MTDKPIDTKVDKMDIGQTLIDARESQNITIATASMQTNLSHVILTKLENNQFSEIGAPVFTRGYLNIYARYLGLNANELSDAFNAIGTDNQTDIRLTPVNVASQQKSFKRNHAFKWLLLVPLFLLAAFILMQVINPDSWLMQQVKMAFPDNSNTTTETFDSDNNEIVLEINDGDGSSDTTSQNIPSLTSLDDSANTETAETAETALMTGETDAETFSVEEVAGVEAIGYNGTLNSIDKPTENEFVNSNNQEDELSSFVEAIESTDELETGERVVSNTSPTLSASGKLTITGENWVEVKDSAGKVIASRVFNQGDTISLPASGSPYSLNVGRPNSLELTINGQQQALSSYRLSGSTRLFSVDID